MAFYFLWCFFVDGTLKKISAPPLQISENSRYTVYLGFLLFQGEEEGGQGWKMLKKTRNICSYSVVSNFGMAAWQNIIYSFIVFSIVFSSFKKKSTKHILNFVKERWLSRAGLWCLLPSQKGCLLPAALLHLWVL